MFFVEIGRVAKEYCSYAIKIYLCRKEVVRGGVSAIDQDHGQSKLKLIGKSFACLRKIYAIYSQ